MKLRKNYVALRFSHGQPIAADKGQKRIYKSANRFSTDINKWHLNDGEEKKRKLLL